MVQAVGCAFHNTGGIPPLDLKQQPTGRYLSFAERKEIALLKAQDTGPRDIASAVGRDPQTISRGCVARPDDVGLTIRTLAASRDGRSIPRHRATKHDVAVLLREDFGYRVQTW